MSRFITNGANKLKNVVKNVIEKSSELKFLVGYFYFSGFGEISEDLREKPLKILVGMDAEVSVLNSLKEFYVYKSDVSGFSSNDSSRQSWFNLINKVFNDTDIADNKRSQDSFRIFLEKLRNGTLEIRKTKEPNHSKLYIFTFPTQYAMNDEETSEGEVIIGSSNFSIQGFEARNEVNVYLKEHDDYKDAKNIFDELWNNSIPLIDKTQIEKFEKEVVEKIWINKIPHPYIIYLRALHEFFVSREDYIKTPSQLVSDESKSNYFDVSYQTDAIIDGVNKVNVYDGCILADVVGLGKSVIAVSIAKNLENLGGIRKTIIITPPHLQIEWQNYCRDFNLNSEIFTSGKILDAIKKYGSKQKLLIIVDEAHKYRNSLTEGYKVLHELCTGNKVLLLSATPFNNSPEDLKSLICLFQVLKKSTIANVENLYFELNSLIKDYKNIKKSSKDLKKSRNDKKAEEIAKRIRNILSPVVIRRTRIDLEKIEKYKNDLIANNINFSKVNPPEMKSYKLGELSSLYADTLEKISPASDKTIGFKGARYMPLVYLKDNQGIKDKYLEMFDVENFTGQSNMGSFFRTLIVRRFESSIYSFKMTIDNVLTSMNNLKKMIDEKGIILFNKKGKISFDEIEEDDDEQNGSLFDIDEVIVNEKNTINEWLKKGYRCIDANDLKDDFHKDLENDINIFMDLKQKWKDIENDPKVENLIVEIKNSLIKEKNRKIVVFSEFADTADYVYKCLKENGVNVLLRSSKNASSQNKNEIIENFDAGLPQERQKNDYDVLVGTDSISEGVSLHRAGTIYNYDIPYNPTRVIQRVGRINRINKKMFDKLFIYNFFPTIIGEEETRIIGISTFKIKLLQAIFGADTAVLTDDESLKGYIQTQFNDEDENYNDEISWDVEYRNDLNKEKSINSDCYQDALKLPKKCKIKRTEKLDCKNNIIVFSKKGSSFRFISCSDFDNILLPAQKGFEIFKCSKDEKDYDQVDNAFWEKYDKIKLEKPRSLVQDKIDSKNVKCAIDKIKNYKNKNNRRLSEKEIEYLSSIEKLLENDALVPYDVKRICKLKQNDDNFYNDLVEIVDEMYVSKLVKKIHNIEIMNDDVVLCEEFR